MNSTMKTAADLKGKRLANNAFGAQSDVLTQHAISKIGLDPVT